MSVASFLSLSPAYHRSYLDSEKEGVHRYPELQLHFAGLIANIISSVPQGQSRVLLFSAVTRQTLFYLFANWCGLFGQRVDMDVRSRNPQVSFSSLQAMSALLCCGPVFQSNGLDTGSPLYRWMDNMLTCSETRVRFHCTLRTLPPQCSVCICVYRSRLSAVRRCNCCCTIMPTATPSFNGW